MGGQGQGDGFDGEHCPKCHEEAICYSSYPPYVQCGECGWIPEGDKEK